MMMNKKKLIIQAAGLVLVVLFFVAPLVQCSQDSSLSATGLEIATKTGKLMGEADKGYPIVFLLLAIPIILIIVGFIGKSFNSLRIVSVLGLVAQIAFMITAYAMLNSGDFDGGAFVLTGLNWLLIAIHAGIIGFTQYCIIQDKKSTET
jgi:hypothetical protein